MILDTIAAIATGMSNSGIGIIRISGDDAIEVADRIFRSANKNKLLKDEKSHTIHYGYIMENENIVDEVLVSVMKAPNTYTKEDVVEINCHGGIVVVNKVLNIILKNGARIAEPGEFTKRAFLNGRIDLSQAEAVIDVINSKNEYALKNSVGQLRGKLSEKIRDIREDILSNIAFIEAALDDPEHITMENYDEELLSLVLNIEKELNKILNTYDNGQVIKEGIKTAILGKPNAGKSSFLNALLGEERAIVTDIEGTTRDTLKESIIINGINLEIIDTAGIRNTEDVVEKIGVDKSREAAKEADLILYVIDSTKKLDENDFEIIELLKDKKFICLLNKSDLVSEIQKSDYDVIKKLGGKILSVSAKDNLGIEEFEELITDMFIEGKIAFNDEVYLTNARQKNSIFNALASIKMVKESIENGMPEDFFTIDLSKAYEELGKVIGESVEDDLIEKIFSSFCMGK